MGCSSRVWRRSFSCFRLGSHCLSCCARAHALLRYRLVIRQPWRRPRVRRPRSRVTDRIVRALIIQDDRTVKVEERPVPKTAPDELLLRITTLGLNPTGE